MTKEKLPQANLKLTYRKHLESGLIVSLVLMIILFQLPEFNVASREATVRAVEIEVKDIPPTEQLKKAPPPPRPSVPVPTENEDIPEDVTIETTELDLSEIPPPPPPPESENMWDSYQFIPYDEAPQPIGGYAEILNNLKYPEIARKAGLTASVIIGILIDENGNPIKTQILSSSVKSMGFEEAAQNAVKSVKWKPAKQRDKNVKVWVSLPIRFELNNPS